MEDLEIDLFPSKDLLYHCMQSFVILHKLGEKYLCNFSIVLSIVLIGTRVSCCVVQVKISVKVSLD